MSFICPCDLCNGRLTGAWEDEPTYERQVEEDYGPDPYAGLCLACGADFIKEDGSEHTMADCEAPWYWSAYEGADRDERIKEDRKRIRQDNLKWYQHEFEK